MKRWILLILLGIAGCQNPAIERRERVWQERIEKQRQEYLASRSWTAEEQFRIRNKAPWIGMDLEAFRYVFGSDGGNAGEDLLGSWNLLNKDGVSYFFRNERLVAIEN